MKEEGQRNGATCCRLMFHAVTLRSVVGILHVKGGSPVHLVKDANILCRDR